MISLFKKITKKIIYNSLPFKSQKDQDKWVIISVLPFKIRGYLVDLAAADGVTHSNTYVLEKIFKWRGICIEPNPHFSLKLRQNRDCIIEDSVVSDRKEKIKFRIDNGQLGGIVAEDTDNNMNIRSDELKNADIIELEATTLNKILIRHKAPKVIDYLSLDVEGSEERIIKSFDFNTCRFNCITIERPTPKVNEILFQNDYLFVKNYLNDSFYIHSSLAYKKRIHSQNFEQLLRKDW